MILNIQILRALAALAVVFFHTWQKSTSYGIGKVGDISFLASGVDLFFIISGFIIVLIQKRKSRGPLEFIIDRFVRIAPLYYILTMSVVCIFLVYPEAFRDRVFHWNDLLVSLLFINHIAGNYPEPMIWQGWTLEYEMIFYSIFSLCLLSKSTVKTSVLTISAIVVLYFLGMSDIMLEFCYGMISAHIFQFAKKSNIISIALLIFSIVAILNVGNFNMNYRFIYYGIPCLAFFWSAILANDISIKPLVFIGNASYSIYLSHFIVVSFICKEFSKHLTVKSPVDVFFFYLLTVFISVFIGILTYLLVEKPMTRFFSIYIK